MSTAFHPGKTTFAEYERLGQDHRFELAPLEMLTKRKLYLSAGSQVVWIVYPETRAIHIYECDSARIEREVLNEMTLFPGFALALSDLFA